MATNNAGNMNVTGLQALDSAGVITGRTLVGTANQMAFTNGDGTGGNPTLAFVAPTIFTSTQPMVLAYLSATTAAVTGAGAVYTVIFDTEINDQGPNYNNATGVFTAPVLGNYFVAGNVAFGGLGTTTAYTSYINSSAGLFDGSSNNLVNVGVGGYIWCPFSGLVRLSAAQTISIQVTGQGGTATNTIIGGSIFSWLSILLVN